MEKLYKVGFCSLILEPVLRSLESSGGEISVVADIVFLVQYKKLNLFTSTEFTRRNGIFNILNIKYIIKKKIIRKKTKTFYNDFISLSKSVDAVADLAFLESLELSQCPWKCPT